MREIIARIGPPGGAGDLPRENPEIPAELLAPCLRDRENDWVSGMTWTNGRVPTRPFCGRILVRRQMAIGFFKPLLLCQKVVMPKVRWRALIQVLKEARPAWLSIVGATFALLIGWIISCSFSQTTSATIRYAGTLLQIFGLATAAYGLSQTLQLFGSTVPKNGIISWWNRLKGAFGLPRIVTAKAHSGLTLGGSAEMRKGLHCMNTEGSAEDRIANVEANVGILEERLDDYIQRLKADIADVRDIVDRDSQARQSSEQRIERRIEDFAIGGLQHEVIGLIWLFFGIIGASVPDELAKAWSFLTE